MRCTIAEGRCRGPCALGWGRAVRHSAKVCRRWASAAGKRHTSLQAWSTEQAMGGGQGAAQASRWGSAGAGGLDGEGRPHCGPLGCCVAPWVDPMGGRSTNEIGEQLADQGYA